MWTLIGKSQWVHFPVATQKTKSMYMRTTSNYVWPHCQIVIWTLSKLEVRQFWQYDSMGTTLSGGAIGWSAKFEICLLCSETWRPTSQNGFFASVPGEYTVTRHTWLIRSDSKGGGGHSICVHFCAIHSQCLPKTVLQRVWPHYMHGAAQKVDNCEHQLEFFTRAKVEPRTRADHCHPTRNIDHQHGQYYEHCKRSTKPRGLKARL